jgi:serine/threonine-protein kinase
MRRFWIVLLYAMLAIAVASLGAYLVVAFMIEKAPEVEVPDVANMALTDALDTLNARGLELEVRGFSFSDDVEVNRVVRQRPSAGSIVKAGRGVGVVLSRGGERQFVPDLIGQFEEDANITLAQAGLTPAPGVRIPGDVAGVVIAQSRVPGTKMSKGDQVFLLVSTGPELPYLRMPNLSGTPISQAESELSALGLKISRVEDTQIGDPTRTGRVIGQEPLPGAKVQKGSEVTLSVAAD